jgi:beta-glucanase (GH16 family)
MMTLLLILLQAAPGKLVWSDEFDKEGAPDPAKWDFEVGLVRNQEKQYYTKGRPENARVEGGHLVIEARKEDWEKAKYTSASLVTKGKASWTGGRVEVRAKLPQGRGTWPAIWMLGESIGKVGWPACGEIDLMEFVGYDPGRVHANIHTKAYNHMNGKGKGSPLALAEPWKDFHVYAVDWTQEKLDFSVDGKVFFTYANEKKGAEVWPFDQPHYLILNLAIGGAWGGQKGIDDAIFPQQFRIDYVRVYQLP